MGLAVPSAQVGDTVVLLFGSNTPWLLRKRGEGRDGYFLVGEVYVHGVMHGEAMKWKKGNEVFDIY